MFALRESRRGNWRQALGGLEALTLGWSWGLLGAILKPFRWVLGSPGAVWEALGVVLVSPSSPSGLVTTPGLNPPPSKFDLKASQTSLHFSSLFLLRLGSLLGSILAPSWAPFSLNFGPSCLLTPYFFENMNFQKNEPRPRRERDFGDRSGPRSAHDGSKIALRRS